MQSSQQGRDEHRNRRRLSTGTVVVFFLLAVLVAVVFVWPFVSRLIEKTEHARLVINAKNCIMAMSVFASDKGIGRFPNGSYDPETGKITSDVPAASAEECFQDLFRSEVLTTEEFLFWIPKNRKQCRPDKPDGDGILKPGENGWDYIAGMYEASGDMPLIIEASDSGDGRNWTDKGGHPWSSGVVVGYADGTTCRIEPLNSRGEAMSNRSGNKEAALAFPIPGKHGWPESAEYVPATPVSR